jgi:hypothetical protein
MAASGRRPPKRRGQEARARELAQRYRCEFVTCVTSSSTVFRYPGGADVPLQLRPAGGGGGRSPAIAMPTQPAMMIDASAALGKRIPTKVATLGQIADILKDGAVAALDEASEGHAGRHPRRRGHG